MSDLVNALTHLSQLYNERKQVMYSMNKEHLEPEMQNLVLEFLKEINEDIINNWSIVNRIKLRAKKTMD